MLSFDDWVWRTDFRPYSGIGAMRASDASERAYKAAQAMCETEIALLREAVRRYGDRSRMATVEPMELQQAIDRAMSESNCQ